MQQLSRAECGVIASLIALVMIASIGTFKTTLEKPALQTAHRSTE